MAGYKNYEIDYKKNANVDDMFKQPKSMVRKKDYVGERRDRIIDWVTFYRRNPHRFAEHYFGVELYTYQKFWLYLMSQSTFFVAICSRAAAKSWLIALFALIRSVLYPGSEIVIVSSTMAQAGLIISDKVVKLKDDHPNIRREISNITTNQNKWSVSFHNGSKIKVVAAGEQARGNRSTFTIYEEFRLIDKDVVDQIIQPFAYARQAPFMFKKEYSNRKEVIEEPREVYISSAYYKEGYWWYNTTLKACQGVIKGIEGYGVMFFDYLISLRHNIKTKKSMDSARVNADVINFSMEYENIPYSSSDSSYFKVESFSRDIRNAFYPQRLDEYDGEKNPYKIERDDGEIRLVTVDIAMRTGRKNDNTIISCTRLFPTQNGYERHIVYLESHNGKNSLLQAIRIRQVYDDFDADYIVLDVQNAGISIYDMLGTAIKDVERGGAQYQPMTVMEHDSIDKKVREELSERTTGLNPLPVIYPISASARLNSEIASAFRDSLRKGMCHFLVNDNDAETFLMKKYKDFLSDSDGISMRTWYLMPFVQTSLLVNECISLDAEIVSGNIKLKEPPGGRKDRFTSVSYMNYLASIFDKELIREEDTQDDWDIIEACTIIF